MERRKMFQRLRNKRRSSRNNGVFEKSGVLRGPPKSDYSIIKDVANRQLGFNNSVPNRFHSSLHAIQSLKPMHELKVEQDFYSVTALGFNKTANLIASASNYNKIAIYNWALGKKLATLNDRHDENSLTLDLKWLPIDTESSVVTCSLDGGVRLLDIRTNTSRKIAEHTGSCNRITTLLDSPYVVLSTGDDSEVLSIDTREQEPIKLLNRRDDDPRFPLYSIHSNPSNSNEFCVAGQTVYVKIYDRRKTTNPVQQFYPRPLSICSVKDAIYNHNGSEIIASYVNGITYLFNVSTSYQKGDFTASYRYQDRRNSFRAQSIKFFGPNSEYILSRIGYGNIVIWDKKTETIVKWIHDAGGLRTTNIVETHPNVPIVAAGGLNLNIKIWVPSYRKKPDIRSAVV